MASTLRFPDGFLWGAATSSYQVEGYPLADGAGRSIWHTFAHTPGNMVNDENGDVACDHYHRFREDVALMREVGLNAYHFSISWPRVLPEGVGRVNALGLDFYDRLVDELVAAGISPAIVLYAWELPTDLQDLGGWANRDCAEWFGEYTSVVYRRLGDRVTHWLSMCEPMSIAHHGHIVGALAPGMRDLYTGLKVGHHLMLGHGRAVQAFRASGGIGEFGIINAQADIQAASDSDADRAAAERVDTHFNALFLDPIMRGEYPPAAVEWLGEAFPEVRDGDLDIISTPMDFIGIDYYCRTVVADDPDGSGVGGKAEEIGAAGPLDSGMARLLKVRVVAPDGPFTDIGWEITPDSLGNALRWLRDRYDNPPVVITEFGAAFRDEVGPDGAVDDPKRLAYLRDHAAAAHAAIEDGVDLRGIFIWSFIDTYEFNLGYDARFGLVRVDYKTLDRTVKSSGRWWGAAARANGFDVIS
ncbi:glycoside hydrolase family 1 protein [Pseudonocardia acaciae]|uniref:glycoside hydrolase family 1 protein n=1 Tax=Pseudonocardia acaciae TaxID=551276 RepID=UPI0004917BAD|nr:family 1 glycosylhydrolase [Pseudonocardia acaciae]